MGESVLIPASSNEKPIPTVRGAGQSFPPQHSTDVTPALAPKIPPNMQELQLMGVRMKELTPVLVRTKIFEGSAEITVTGCKNHITTNTQMMWGRKNPLIQGSGLIKSCAQVCILFLLFQVKTNHPTV